jgi:hypothetical protein
MKSITGSQPNFKSDGVSGWRKNNEGQEGKHADVDDRKQTYSYDGLGIKGEDRV